ncbi:hypothetical protein HHK36_016460 [Tetracentron sinense]|uniref:F-box domain-containing protein n=1 Tax=Tetracentron sinense TaxID=13715 RepID=A0A834Z0C9_TETSI|nr:hypothetical protein HHK36_016460 [Tetracentron sinense]
MIMGDKKLDLISNLPDEILRRIVSFLPLKLAVRTSILSTRWRSLWMPSHVNLDFHLGYDIAHHEINEEVMQIIGKFLGSYNAHKLWRLYLGPPEIEKSSSIAEDELTFLATMGVDKELHLDFSEGRQMRSNFNLNLDLTCPGLGSHATTSGSFASLKTLHLRSVTHLAENMAPTLFSNCQLLESLKLVNCTGLQCLDINVDTGLKSLIVMDCQNMADITLSAPNLQTFMYRGVLPQFHLKNVSCLVDAMLDFRDGPGDSHFDCEDLLSLLASISNVEILTLSGWLLQLDLISSLPDDILRRVVSFLPLKLAVGTSILSTRWQSLWMPSHVNLDFNLGNIARHETNKEVMQIIGKFLGSYNAHKLWRLYLGHPQSGKSSRAEDELTFLATMGVDKELHLDFSECQQLTRNFNLNLELSCPDLGSHAKTSGSFASLKTLQLRSVTHLAENMVPTLFSNCQLLESLKLVNCTGLQCLEISVDTGLKSLIVMDCQNIADITLSAPKLQTFKYRGVLPQFHLKNVSCLVDAMLDFRDGPGYNQFDCEELLSLLASIANVEILTLSGWLLQWLCSSGMIFSRLDFQFNNLKELWWIDSLIDRPKRDSLSCFLNICPLLEKLFIDIDQKRKCIDCPFFHHYWHEPHLWMDYTAVRSCALQLNHLKIVKMVGLTNKEDELLLMDLLLCKAISLKSMIVTSPENHSWRVLKIPGSQLKQTSRGQRKHIAIASQGKEYFYEYIEEDSSRLCPAHEQMCL